MVNLAYPRSDVLSECNLERMSPGRTPPGGKLIV